MITQMNPNVSVIPATVRSARNGGQLRSQTHLRVAAYCRVSTDDESQQTSYAIQKDFYTSMIGSQSGWRFAGIYADEAISGTSTAHRVAFNRMVEDAKAGKMDYIVSKSISRFARNTVDTLTCIRELRQLDPPVGVYFEKENLDTLDATGELILTIMSALAQDESRSISDNIRWAFQRMFQAGKPQLNLKRMLGYDKGEDGAWVINPEQAETVRYMFERFVYGQTANQIARELNELGRKTVNGRKWSAGSVLFILRNEKYVGDLAMQKTVTKNFLTHRSTVNRGEAPKYYIPDHHAAIIDRTTWAKVQAMLCSRPKRAGSAKRQNPIVKGPIFRNLICGERLAGGKECGAGFYRFTYTGVAKGYTDARSLKATGEDTGDYLEKYSYAYPVWRCKRKVEGRRKSASPDCAARQAEETACLSEVYHEAALKQSFMEMLYRLKRDYETKGEQSEISARFKQAYASIERHMRGSTISARRLETLDAQLKEWRDTLEAMAETQTAALPEAEEIRRRICDLEKEKRMLENEQSVLIVMQRNFDFFIECLKRLTERNAAGMALKVNGLDVQGSLMRDAQGRPVKGKTHDLRRERIKVTPQVIADAPDMLPFEKGIYCAFFEAGKAKGDQIAYRTNFGVTLLTLGNRRTLNSFLGYKRCSPDGEVVYVDAAYKVYGSGIQYRRYLSAAGKKRLDGAD